jgi:hypothetical protein
MKLQDLAQVIRSKNAGPRCLTLDIIFTKESDFHRVIGGGALGREKLAELYGLSAELIRVVEYPLANAIKISMPRAITAGDPGDRDVYGAQQHTPLLQLEI